MTIVAARVMAAGKAGLDSLPYFVDELLSQGIRQLAPWAGDHSEEQIEELRKVTEDRRNGSWKVLHSIGNADPGYRMEPDLISNRNLLARINPLAAEASGLADSPAQLAAWCRRQIWQHCRDTVSLWDRFRYDNGVTGGEQLAIVIPFCPEGPTSGTVGMYLGAALRHHFAELNRQEQLVVWGVELCPPLVTSDAGDFDALGTQSAFRGYVARQELLRGVPLSENPDDENYQQPFDITLVFDGGAIARSATSSSEDIWKAMDRAAAQTTACLLNGAAGGDEAESTNWLKQGRRWNAFMAQVVSERSYGDACRYLSYQVSLPWHRDRAEWDRTKTAQQKDAFLRRIDRDIYPMLKDERNDTVKERIQWLVDAAEEVRSIKWDQTAIVKRLSGREKKVQGVLQDAISGDEHRYSETCKDNPAPETITPKIDPFCLNIDMPERLRREAAMWLRDHSRHRPIAEVLGATGVAAARRRIEELCGQVLSRSDCQSSDIDSQALFEQIISISITDLDKGRENLSFQPSREFLRYFIGVDSREISGSYSELSHDLNVKMRPVPQDDNEDAPQTKTLGWNIKGIDYDVPVEYSFLVLARVRPEDGFRDVSTYDTLRREYDKLIGNQDRWREHVRYYGVKPPPELLDTASGDSREDSAALANNGQVARPDLIPENA